MSSDGFWNEGSDHDGRSRRTGSAGRWTILDAIMFAHEEIKKIVEFIEEIVKEVGKPKMEIELYKVPEDIEAAVREYAEDKMRAAIQTYDKMERLDNMDAVEAETKEHFAEIYPDNGKDIGNVLYTITKEQVRKHDPRRGHPSGQQKTHGNPSDLV